MWYTGSVREAHQAVRRRHRLGWLLRVNRLFATRPRYTRLRNFAAEFSRDGSVATTVGTFSRWETGVSTVPYLRILGGPEERRHVERLLLAPSTPSGIRDTAASALGHIGGVSQEDYWTLALRTARQRWHQSPTAAEISVLDRHVYALGMADRRALLRTVTADPTLPDVVRSAANWWLTLPLHIRESART